MEEYDRAFQNLELWQIPFELLETALYDLFRVWEDTENLHFVREANLPPGIAQFRLYVGRSRAQFDTAEAEYLGYIRFMKLSVDVSQIEQQCLVRGDKNKLFVDMMRKWKVHTSSFEAISKEVRKRNRGRGLQRLRKGKPGRPHKPEDTWAWHQVNTMGRSVNEVFEEWLANDEVKKRVLQDPKTHFYRFIKRNAMGD